MENHNLPEGRKEPIMAKSKSSFMSALMFLVDFISSFFKAVEKLGITTEELYEAMKSAETRRAMAEAVAGVLEKTSRPALAYLRPIKERITVSTEGFSKKKFFGSKLGVKIFTGSNFDNWIIPELSETVPAFEGFVDSLELSKNMYNSEIRPKIGEDDVRTPDEAVAILGSMVMKQPEGEAGDLIENGCGNLLYVRLKSGEVVAVSAYWCSDDRMWRFGAVRLDGNGGWSKGRRVLSRS